MRTAKDRLRHTILFEIMALIIVISFTSLVLGFEAVRIGSLSVAMCLWAMVWNALYNYIFDRTLLAMGRSLKQRPPGLRALHSFLFEAGLVIQTLPLVAWWMQLGLFEAFLMNAGFMIFYLIYGYAFNWIYDQLFPIPAEHSAT